VTGQGFGTSDDYTTIKYSSAGDTLWVRSYNGPQNASDGANDIAVDGSGNVYVTGRSHGGGTLYDYATVKYDSAGVERWVARYQGSGRGDDAAGALAIDGWGNVYVTGNSYGTGTRADYATVKYDSAGIEQWVARYNGPANGDDGPLRWRLTARVTYMSQGAAMVPGPTLTMRRSSMCRAGRLEKTARRCRLAVPHGRASDRRARRAARELTANS